MNDDLFAGFESHWVDTEAGRIFARSRGDGPPLVLLHGFPQTHVMWHRLAPTLAETHRVVCMDLRGYGWSSAPKGDAAHETYSKRAMARDVVTVMEELGTVHFAVAGHDRGARVGYRLALDHPGRVERLALLDILPTSYVWAQMKAGKVPAAHWAYLSEPFPKPEEEIGRDPIPYFEGLMKTWSAPGDLSAFDPRAMAAYRDGFNEPSRIHAFCEDYRAGATRDIEADEADLAAGKSIRCPTQLIWSDFYLVSGTSGDTIPPLEIWRTFAPGITGIGV
ncbi:MAG: alpha/beta fold hydrolase, partial [Microvirga sp.]|nr:alpha/beta fold hydrolase [Microvirga sp.]